MKVDVKRNPVKPAFEPVVITITLETAAEVQAAYDVGNHSSQIGTYMRDARQYDADAQQIHILLMKAFYNPVYRLFGCLQYKHQRLTNQGVA